MAIGHRPLDLRLGRRRRAEDVERYTALRARRRITTDGFAGDGIGDGVARGDPMRLPGGVRFRDVVGHVAILPEGFPFETGPKLAAKRSEEHTSELQSLRRHS